MAPSTCSRLTIKPEIAFLRIRMCVQHGAHVAIQDQSSSYVQNSYDRKGEGKTFRSYHANVD